MVTYCRPLINYAAPIWSRGYPVMFQDRRVDELEKEDSIFSPLNGKAPVTGCYLSWRERTEREVVISAFPDVFSFQFIS